VADGLSIRGLRLEVARTGDDIVDEVDLAVAPGEVLGLVGESGSGKTTVGLAVLGHARRGVRIAGGSISIGSTDVLALGAEERRSIRGRLVSYVPQDPSSSLNPALRIGLQLREVLEAHDFGGSDGARRARVAEMMAEVLLPADDEFLARYPHQLSGGQQQRVALAMAFACRPSVIVLDEPTTGLDVSTQEHVLATVRSLAREHGIATIYITHDIAVAVEVSDRVAVMYAGQVVETGSVRDILRAPQHPYTRGLLAANLHGAQKGQRLQAIPGAPPPLDTAPVTCSFAPRCPLKAARCEEAAPPNVTLAPGRQVRCIHAQSEAPASAAQ